MTRPTGRPRKLSPELERAMQRKWKVHQRTSAANLARHYGLSLAGFYEIVNGRQNWQIVLRQY